MAPCPRRWVSDDCAEQSNHSAEVIVSDTVYYTSCLRWRAKGEAVRQTYNLSVHNAFLLLVAKLIH
jgi:hypothetical protein